MQGNLSDLSGCQMEVSGYEVTASTESDGMDFSAVGKDFHMAGEDPQLILTLPAGMQLGGIALDFETAVESPLPVQVFTRRNGRAMRKSILSRGNCVQAKQGSCFRFRRGNTVHCGWILTGISGLRG